MRKTYLCLVLSTVGFLIEFASYGQCTLTCPDNIVVSTEPGSTQCGANVPFTVTSACGAVVTSVTGDGTPVSSGDFFPVGTTTVTSTGGGAQCSFQVTVNDATPPSVTCPASTSASANAVCQAAVPNVLAGVFVTDNCSAPASITLSQSPTAGTLVGLGVTTITVTAMDAAGNQSTCITSFTVNDRTSPQITCPANIRVSPDAGQCSAVVNFTIPTATDACGTATVVASPVSGSTFPVGTTVVTLTATDQSNNTAQCTFTVTVNNPPPSTISNLTATPAALWPPNHKMQTITLSYTLTNSCSCTPSITVTSNEPENGTGDGDTSPDWALVDDHHIQLRAERGNNRDQRVYTITVSCTDQYNGTTTTATTTVTVAHNITGPLTGTPFKVGSSVNFAGVFWDKPGNTHTAQWLINDKTTVKGSATEPSGNKNGKVAGTYKFSSTGIYRLQMNLTDQNKITSYANTNEDQEEIIVIYDPNGGYAYGGGYFDSKAGALTSNAAATGKATYGFTVNYYKGATLPKGETRFNFNLGGFQYDALNFDYLSVAGYKAVFRGSGKITGGQSGVNFMMYVIDGSLDGSGVDKLRLKIYNKNTTQVYYDNEAGKSDAADPITPVGLNSTIIINGANTTVSTVRLAGDNITADARMFELNSYPNPSYNSFNITAESPNKTTRIHLKVTNALGQVIEQREVRVGQSISVGGSYKPGIYVVEAIQGNLRKQIKLSKISQ